MTAAPQPVLSAGQHGGEIRIEHQIGQRRITGVGFPHPIEKARADDAAAAPDRGDDPRSSSQPCRTGRRHDRETLGIGRRSSRPAARRAGYPDRRSGSRSFGLPARQDASPPVRARPCGRRAGGRRPPRRWWGRDPEIQRRGYRPAAGALLPGAIQDDLDHRRAGIGVALAQDCGGDLDQKAIRDPPGSMPRTPPASRDSRGRSACFISA